MNSSIYLNRYNLVRPLPLQRLHGSIELEQTGMDKAIYALDLFLRQCGDVEVHDAPAFYVVKLGYCLFAVVDLILLALVEPLFFSILQTAQHGVDSVFRLRRPLR